MKFPAPGLKFRTIHDIISQSFIISCAKSTEEEVCVCVEFVGSWGFEYYSIQTLITVATMIAMIFMVRSNEFFGRRRNVSFAICFGMVAVAGVSEWLGVVLDGTSMRTYGLHVAVKTLELSVAPMIPAVLAISVNNERRLNPVFGVMSVNMVLEIISAFAGFIFYVDDANIYRHGTLYYVYYVFVAAGVAYLIYETYMLGVNNQSWHRARLIPMLLILLLGMLPHMIHSRWHFEWLCSGIAVILYYMYCNAAAMITDALTGVFGRAAYEKAIARLKPGRLVVSFDLDNFKHVNDAYGHLYGDQALVGAAKIIRSVYGKYGCCYRIGGDEFCALLPGRDLPGIDAFNAAFNEELARVRETDSRFPWISRGYFRYESDSGDIRHALNVADLLLYNDKNTRSDRDK